MVKIQSPVANAAITVAVRINLADLNSSTLGILSSMHHIFSQIISQFYRQVYKPD